MSKIHVLTNNDGKYLVSIHFSTPTGNNTASIAWKQCILRDGQAKTAMSVGSNAGQISTAEKTSIESGDKVEITRHLMIESGGATKSSLDELADRAIIDAKNSLRLKYKYYGYTQGV